MIVFLNGKFVPEERAMVSVFDRSFLYGDGLFEGLLVTKGQPFHWARHMERLAEGVRFAKMAMPYSYDQLQQFAAQLIARNKMPECMLRLTITRGVTGRTYSPRDAKNPAIVMTLHPTPVITKMLRWPVIISSLRLMADDPLTHFKSNNKMRQVLARAEADAAGATEAILLNSSRRVAEGTTSNVFWIKRGAVCTPPLNDSALPGVTRSLILELCGELNVPCREKAAHLSDLRTCDGAFLTMTSMGVVEIASLDGINLPSSPVAKKLWRAYQGLLKNS